MMVLSKLGPLLGSLIQHGTYDLGYPRRDLNFDNHPYDGILYTGKLRTPATRDLRRGRKENTKVLK